LCHFLNLFFILVYLLTQFIATFSPNDKSIQKIIYLALKNASKKWTMPIKNENVAINCVKR